MDKDTGACVLYDDDPDSLMRRLVDYYRSAHYRRPSSLHDLAGDAVGGGRVMSTTPVLSFLGATGTVTGSKFLIETDRARVLVDAGLYQGVKRLRLRNREVFPVDPATIDAVVVTHAHLDHVGYLPLLVMHGFAGPIVCTTRTAQLAEIVLVDSGRLQQEEAEFANAHGFSKHHPAEPLYTEADARQAVTRFRPIGFDTTIDVARGISATLQPAGHILGSAGVLLELDADSGPARVRQRRRRARRPPDPDRARPRRRRSMRSSSNPPMATASTSRKKNWSSASPTRSPAPRSVAAWSSSRRSRSTAPRSSFSPFANSSTRDGYRICPSTPTARWRSRCSRSTGGRSPPAMTTYAPGSSTPTHWRPARCTRPAHAESRRHSTGCASRRSSSRRRAWQPVDASLHHLARLLPDPRNTVILAGYQAEGTRGRLLANHVPSVKMLGRYVPVRAEIVVADAFSAHADADDLIAWLGRAPAPPTTAYVVHGEPDASAAFAARLQRDLQWNAVVPGDGERVRV